MKLSSSPSAGPNKPQKKKISYVILPVYRIHMALVLLVTHSDKAFFTYYQHAKKVMSDSPGRVDFAIGLVIFVLNLPDRQVFFSWEIQITEGL